MRFSEMNDTDLQYAAINDKVSRQSIIDGLDYQDLIKQGYRNFDKGLSEEELIDDRYEHIKDRAVDSLKYIEEKLGRPLTSDEMVDIYDLIDISGFGAYDARKLSPDVDYNYEVSEYDEDRAESFNKKVNYIVQAIEYGILDKVHDMAMKKAEHNPTFTIDDFAKNRFFDDYVIKSFNEIMDEEYGSPEKKASDELPISEEEPLSKEDLLNLEDFEDIYRSAN